MNKYFFSGEKRLVFKNSPDAPKADALKPSPEQLLQNANREAADAIRQVQQRAEELKKSDDPNKRKWGSQLENSLKESSATTKRILEGLNQNKALADGIKTNCLKALEAFGAPATPEKKPEPASAKEDVTNADFQATMDLMRQESFRQKYNAVIQKVDNYIEEANARKQQEYGDRPLGYHEKLHNPAKGNVDFNFAADHPNLMKLFADIDEIHQNPGSTPEEYENSVKKMEALAVKSRFQEAVRNDRILSDLRSAVSSDLVPNLNKAQNERRILQAIISRRLRVADHFAAAEDGSSWEITTYGGVSVRLTKHEGIDYSVEITGLAERAIPRYAAVAKDLGLKPTSEAAG